MKTNSISSTVLWLEKEEEEDTMEKLFRESVEMDSMGKSGFFRYYRLVKVFNKDFAIVSLIYLYSMTQWIDILLRACTCMYGWQETQSNESLNKMSY